MRTYERTHPWIDFQLDLRRMQPATWMLLGEAQSKVQHVAGAPLLPGIQEHFLEVYLAKGVQATTAIEGNTLTEEEVLRQVRGELEVPPSKEYLRQEVENVITACNQIGARILGGRPTQLTSDEVLQYNALVLKELPLPEEVVPGTFRRHDVGVGGYKAPPHEDAAFLVDRLCRWLEEGFAATPGQEVAFGVLKAIVAHLYIAWIHPFGDGNGRTARLIEFQTLLGAGVPNVAAHLLSNHYNQTRSEYYRQLDASHRREQGPLAFIHYALQGFVDGLQKQIEIIRAQQLTVLWRNYLHAVLPDHGTKAGSRRRQLAADLSLDPSVIGKRVPVAKVRYLTPRLAEAYAGKTDKTVKRDLNFLAEKGLIELSALGVRGRSEQILAFLPTVAAQSEPAAER